MIPMEFDKPIYQRIDLFTKLIAVVLVAVGIDYLRGTDISGGLFLIVGGGVISLIPFFIDVKELEMA